MIIRGLLLALLVAACAPQPTVPVATSTNDVDGLEQVSSRYFDIAFVRPGVDFSHYKTVLLSGSELAFTTPDRSKQQFPLTNEQKDRFRRQLDEQFGTELANLKNLSLSDTEGPDALSVQVRVQDILATVPARATGRSGWGSLSLQALGEATLVIELSDSESGETLARVYDRRAVEGVAIAQPQAAPIMSWEDVESISERWASTVRERLDALVGSNH